MTKRPEFHFTPEKNWMNDPNGLSFFNGNYHIFFQHNPVSLFWGNMTWGHSISKDMFDWKHQENALIPGDKEDRDGCFSGSAFEKDGELYLAYTGIIMTEKIIDKHGNPVLAGPDTMISTQMFAKSEDGIKFEKLDEPKIVAPEGYCPAHFRDPKVFRKNNKWYMVVGAKKNGKGRVLLYTSEDLKDWKVLHEFFEENMGFMWECPDLFDLQDKQMLIFSPQGIGTEGQEHLAGYYLGEFNYETGEFNHEEFKVLDHGFELYAPQTFEDAKGRRIMIAWLVNHEPFVGEKWTGMMTLPREIKLVERKITMYPVEELKKYRKNEIKLNEIIENESLKIDSEIYDLEFELDSSKDFEIILAENNGNGLKLRYSKDKKEMVFDREGVINDFKALEIFGTTRKFTIDLKEKSNFRVIQDKNVIEIYINGGEKVLTSLVNLRPEQKNIKFSNKVQNIKLYELKK